MVARKKTVENWFSILLKQIKKIFSLFRNKELKYKTNKYLNELLKKVRRISKSLTNYGEKCKTDQLNIREKFQHNINVNDFNISAHNTKLSKYIAFFNFKENEIDGLKAKLLSFKRIPKNTNIDKLNLEKKKINDILEVCLRQISHYRKYVFLRINSGCSPLCSNYCCA